jgi:NTE family protein
MKKLGIALAGGGARGAYQIGAWKALKEAGIDSLFTTFSGASVGSLNAALFAMGDYGLAEKVWLNMDKTTLFQTEKHIWKRLLKERLQFFDKGIYNTATLEELLYNTLDFKRLQEQEVYVATTHIAHQQQLAFFELLRTNYLHYFKKNQQIRYNLLKNYKNEEIVRILLASCAIPIAFRPVVINGETYYDGGILDNAPYKPLIEAGCDAILIIDLFTFSPLRIKRIEGVEVFTIYPKKGLRGVLDFSPDRIHRRFNLGYHDTVAVMDKIKKLIE